jgi:HEPN domain-containing protein
MDLKSAEYLWNMHPLPVEVICYHCQQAVEKLLKGFLAFHGEPIRKTHDLTLLNSICKTLDSSFQLIDNECFELTDYGVNVRYPFSMEVEMTDAKNANDHARKVAAHVMNSVTP